MKFVLFSFFCCCQDDCLDSSTMAMTMFAALLPPTNSDDGPKEASWDRYRCAYCSASATVFSAVQQHIREVCLRIILYFSFNRSLLCCRRTNSLSLCFTYANHFFKEILREIYRSKGNLTLLQKRAVFNRRSNLSLSY